MCLIAGLARMVARKRKPLAPKDVNESEEGPAAKSAKASVAKAQKIISKLQAAVRDKCDELHQAGEDAAVYIRNEYSIQLMLIKKDVRNMTLREFRRLHAADMDPLLLQRVDHCLQMTGCGGRDDLGAVEAPATAALATAMRTTRRRRAAATPATAMLTTRRATTRSRALETPAMRPPGTAMMTGTTRRARLGELLVSQTGSPVEVTAQLKNPTDMSDMVPGTVVRPALGASSTTGGGFATMFVQKRRGGKTKATQGGPGILITLDDGCRVVVTDRETLKLVPPEMQAEVKAQLQQWHSTTASLLQASPP